ncbi:hypothetical protein MKW92_037665 [Papaver armeniacum]|nr:hypothetical protein MKW92_037665 [Papaver armeniacum]
MCQKRCTTKAILCSLSILKVLFFMSLYSILCANGRNGKEWKKLLPYLRTHLGQHRNMTSAPSHVIDITREDIWEGANVVVAVGGDGTLHKVVNGFFWAEKPVSGHDLYLSQLVNFTLSIQLVAYFWFSTSMYLDAQFLVVC